MTANAIRYSPAPRGILAPHFGWNEVVANSGYDAVPLGPIVLPNGKRAYPRISARKHARNLEVLRARVNAERGKRNLPPTGIRILSWARSWNHNVAIHGALNSQHLYFLATDISKQEIERLFPFEHGASIFDYIASSTFKLGGFGTYPGGSRHVDSRGYRARWSDWTGFGRGRV